MKKLETIFYKNKNVQVGRLSNGTLGKRCSNCKQEKGYEEYTVRYHDGRNYLGSLCRECSNRNLKHSRYANKEKTLFHSCKHRATRHDLDFDLVEADIVIPDVCPVLGIPLCQTNVKRQDDTPTVDRVDSSKGYTKDNIAVCSWRANKIKTDATFEEIEKIYLFMKEHNDNKGD